MTSKQIKLLLFLAVLAFFVGCKSTKTLSANGELISNISAKQLIKSNTKNSTKFKTLTSRIKIETSDGKKTQSFSLSMRMEKDKVIWMSKLGIVKAIITPTRVAFYNKLDNTYFDGDFSYLSDLLGTELDFEKVQNLLLGEALFNLNEDEFIASTHDKSYLLTPKEQLDLFEIFYLLNPRHFKMDSQQLAQPQENRLLQIDYKDYQEVESQAFPQNIRILAVESNDETIVDLEYKSITLNENLRFPFRIPSGYKEIELK